MSDWDHGALAALLRGLQGKAGFILSAEAKVAVRVLAVLPVDREFFSADEALRAVRPSVTLHNIRGHGCHSQAEMDVAPHVIVRV